MTYSEALAYIASLAPRGWRFGIDRMHAFCEAAGLRPYLGAEPLPNYIHVAGTNGKGSTTAFTQSILVEAGANTGAYFSPYVVDPRERIQLGREYIGPEELADLVVELRPIAESFTDTPFGGISEFEFKTAVGFRCWQRHACDWIALEVGLGGSLDATNVVTSRAGIIVSIGLDHVKILGETLGEIAREKAGIIKPRVPVIVGEMANEPRWVIEAVARSRQAPIWQYGRDVHWENGTIRTPNRTVHDVRPALVGERQGHNMALAVAALEAAGFEMTDEQIRLGAERAYVPGRFEQLAVEGRTVILDGAHNADAAQVLIKTLDQTYPGRSLVLVTNMLTGHEFDTFYDGLVERTRSVHVVPIDFIRARPVEETTQALADLFGEIHPHATVAQGIAAALSDARPDEIVLVTGSFYLVGEATPVLKK